MAKKYEKFGSIEVVNYMRLEEKLEILHAQKTNNKIPTEELTHREELEI